ncbi:MAG: class I SAM-dependent methyltransferase [Opitutaceae bacterium]|nr:class I SAM-dependent methyltransferase [Opitutaceae bacterium]
MHHDLSQEEVVDFKVRYCNENPSIAKLLHECFRAFIEPPVLDVGCGIGDISKAAFPDVETVLLDKLDFSAFPVAELHRRQLLNFYAYELPAVNPPKTALFSHVLQYLDADPARLLRKVRQLNFPKIITVLNRNDGLMAELLAWGERNIPEGNPELHVPGFPPEPEYAQEETYSFTASLACPDFDILAKQVSYLFDTILAEEQHDALRAFLAERLAQPHLPITQDITGYRRR